MVAIAKSCAILHLLCVREVAAASASTDVTNFQLAGSEGGEGSSPQWSSIATSYGPHLEKLGTGSQPK